MTGCSRKAAVRLNPIGFFYRASMGPRIANSIVAYAGEKSI